VTPTAQEQLAFLTNLQRLMAEGQFVATYKYALLLALADLAVESGDKSGPTLELETFRISEKFIQFYWRQAVPYALRQGASTAPLLRQNVGETPAIINRILAARRRFDGSLADARRHPREWKTLVGAVDSVVRRMPLWKLQTIGGRRADFLYENVGTGSTITLRPGVAYCLRQFHPLISELVRSAWIRYVRRHNHDALGTTSDLSEFLFGSERTSLLAVRGVLEDVQAGRCFYCVRTLAAKTGHVDHFIPWARYPSDLGHNFVLAHSACNGAKADHLAGEQFLGAWVERNARHERELSQSFNERGVVHDLPTSVGIATWAYQQVSQTGGFAWSRRDVLEPLLGQWREMLFRRDLRM
jgi:5-methylcytosine-specific restriction endonuclease McrA